MPFLLSLLNSNEINFALFDGFREASAIHYNFSYPVISLLVSFLLLVSGIVLTFLLLVFRPHLALIYVE